jgi:hypothetical protein
MFWRALLGAALGLALCGAHAAAKDSLVGNWDLDVGKSTFTGRPTPKSGHVSVTAVKGGGMKHVVDYQQASGAPLHYEYTGKADGNDVPVAGNTYFDSVTMIQPDKHTLIRTERRGGKVVGVTTIEVSKDGKTFTGTGKGTLPDGHQFSGSTVWMRAKK